MFSSFMTNTWIVASIVAAVAGFIGFFVVIRGASFAAHALPLGTFPGAAAASLLGINPLFGLIVFAALGVIGIGWLSRRGRHEVATALCLVTLLGFGALFLSMTSEYSQAVYALLFGEVLGVSNTDLAPVAAISGFSIAVAVCALPVTPAQFGIARSGEGERRIEPRDGTCVHEHPGACDGNGAPRSGRAASVQPDDWTRGCGPLAD
ncbi:ABC-type Mn2+/Zn2+ transport system permease subunit [Paraburkholderia sp. Clong3]